MTRKEAVLPGLDCGLCGFRKCGEFASQLAQRPELLERCIHLREPESAAIATSADVAPGPVATDAHRLPAMVGREGRTRVNGKQATISLPTLQESSWLDSLGREFDFYLEHFPEEPGPREAILPHNPMITREMDVQPGDILIGRPLGMSCGCPITHCGEAMEVDPRTGVINWCVTGPLRGRQSGFKDLGYYIAVAYEGLIRLARCEIRIGMRYFFQPRMCMLQWRHSGLVNYLNRTKDGLQVRVEGLWIG